MPRIADPNNPPYADRGEEDSWQHVRRLQRRLYDGGFAGICFPPNTAGSAWTSAYQKAFDDESARYELPLILNTPTFTICCPTILDTGSEAQKRQHISAALRVTRCSCSCCRSQRRLGPGRRDHPRRAARRQVDHQRAKTWSTGAFAPTTGCCWPDQLGRAKHEGLTMFLARLDSPGITLRRIKQVNGSTEFCEEFFDDLELSDDAVVGEVDKGWEVASRSCITSDAPSAAARNSPAVSAPRTTRSRRPTITR